MSEIFKASNGIELNEFGRFKYAHSEIRKPFLDDAVHEAGKEFYQTLRDEELGRWRSKQYPDCVVYRQGDGHPVRILDELNGKSEVVFPESCSDIDDTVYSQVAREWLEAHKPNIFGIAKPGDLWRLTDSDGNTFIATVIKSKSSSEIFFITPDGDEWYEYEITSGELVWSFDEL